MLNAIKTLWKNIRRLSGDDAYEQYLRHFHDYHSEQHEENTPVESREPLSREEFFKQWQDKKWKGVKRCC
ncbi:MAG: YbdD/YjiX family protein [Pseudomonadota bacterium]